MSKDETLADDTLLASGARTDAPSELEVVDPKRYVAGGELARGGMGRIRVARDKRHGRMVAIKEILDPQGDHRRFSREALITARLQHPGIIPVYEAGQWPDGTPFYAMRLVRGQALDKAIAATQTLADRIALLPNVIAAVEAVGYAHDQHVIHRDLKPSNVLVGYFGETVVIDWGLAKDLDAPDEAPPAPRPSHANLATSAELTTTGMLLGTPLYMSPEQARGAEVDARADVYSLGALLYHLISGKPPFAGASSVHEVIARLVDAGAPPLGDVAKTAPRQLRAIIDKAMAHAPDKRYASARELAGDLRRFQAGQLVDAYEHTLLSRFVHWVRRHRLLAGSIIAIAIVVIVAFVGVTRARDRAERNFERSEEAAHFMLTTLRDRLEPLGQLELLDKISEQAIAHYEQRAHDEGSLDRASTVRYASALRLRGDVELELGHTIKARGIYEHALATLGERSGSDAQHERLAAHLGIASLHQRRSEFDLALASVRTARALLANPATTPVDRLAVLVRFGGVTADAVEDLWTGAPALEPEGRAVLTELLGSTTTAELDHDPAVALHVIWAHDYLGDLELARIDTASSQREYETAAELARTAMERWPLDTRFAFALSYAAWGLEALGTVRNSDAYQLALATSERLAKLDARNAHWRAQVVEIELSEAGQNEDTARYPQMLAHSRRADELARILVTEEPDSPWWGTLRIRTISYLAEAELFEEAYDRAITVAREGLPLAERWVRDQPTVFRRRVRLAELHQTIARAQLRKGAQTEAAASFRRLLELREAVAQQTHRMEDIALHIEALYSLANAELAAGHVDVAAAQAEAAYKLAEETIATNKQPAAIVLNRAGFAYDALADVRVAKGDRTGELDARRRALQIAGLYLADAPTEPVRIGYMAWSEVYLAKIETDRALARTLCERAIKRIRALGANAVTGDDQVISECAAVR